MTAILEVSGLEAAYGQSQVLFGLDLAIEAGEVATLLGRNGMGKTTTVRAILGLTPPRSGTVRFRGQSLQYASPDRIARAGIALVPEGRQIFPNLSVEENLIAFAGNRTVQTSPGRYVASMSCFRICRSVAAIRATSFPGASSRCWP